MSDAVKRWDKLIDRSRWPAGPWDGEPDKMQWKDATTGMTCLLVRNAAMGHWCGYVAVPPGHPLHLMGAHEISRLVCAHGGITAALSCTDDDADATPQRGGSRQPTVCHVPEPGQPKDVWWIGFDSAHFGDVQPVSLVAVGVRHFINPPHVDALRGQAYRDVAFMQRECACIAAQVVQIAPVDPCARAPVDDEASTS